MTKHECRMTNECRSSNDERTARLRLPRFFGFRHSTNISGETACVLPHMTSDGPPARMSIMLPFTKMNGAGNDFVMIDNRAGEARLRPEQIARACDRHRGV